MPVKWLFLVRFGLNLGLNNLKFGQEAISDRIDSIGSTRSDRRDRIDVIGSMQSDQSPMGPPMGWGGGWGRVTADDDRGCYDPVDPV